MQQQLNRVRHQLDKEDTSKSFILYKLIVFPLSSLSHMKIYVIYIHINILHIYIQLSSLLHGIDVRRYQYLRDLQDRNETLFHRVLLDNIEELAPIVYTPTVGEACLKFGSSYRRYVGSKKKTKTKIYFFSFFLIMMFFFEH